MEIFILDNVDVDKLRMFLLSVLWRCSISSRPELAHVNLRTEFENNIRELLYKNKASIDDFHIFIKRDRFINENYKQMIFLPYSYEFDSINYYCILFPNGYKVFIKVDSREQPAQLNPLTLKSNSLVHIIQIDNFEETDEFFVIAEKAITMNNNFNSAKSK